MVDCGNEQWLFAKQGNGGKHKRAFCAWLLLNFERWTVKLTTVSEREVAN